MIVKISFLPKMPKRKTQQKIIKKTILEVKKILYENGFIEFETNQEKRYSFSHFLNKNDQEKNKEGRIHIRLNITTQGRFIFEIHIDGAVHQLYKGKISKETEDIIYIIVRILFNYIENNLENIKEFFCLYKI